MHLRSAIVIYLHTHALQKCAEGRTRTDTAIQPLPPQDSVSTSSTTSALVHLLRLNYLVCNLVHVMTLIIAQ